MNAYSVLPAFYEYLMEDCDYETWSQYLSRGIAARAPGRRGADLGCGSGAFTRALAKAGFDVYGADRSPEMLAEAARKNAETGMRVTYVLQDMEKFKPLSRLDFVTAVTDAFNYIPQSRLESAFARIRRGLVRGGLLYFDVSSAFKLREKIADNVFCEDGDEVSYIWFNRLHDDRVEMELTFFLREGEDLYRRKEERHVQYIHEEAELRRALAAAGFEVLAAEGFLGEEKEGSDRLHVWARAV